MEPQSEQQTQPFQEITNQMDFIINDPYQIKISSNFQSGNLSKVIKKQHHHYQLWIAPDPKSSYKSWFYFSISSIQKGATITFTIMNMSNQIKLFKQGHLPVFKTQNNPQWKRISNLIPISSVIKTEEGYQLVFKQQIIDDSIHYFAFTFPWTNKQQYAFNSLIIEENKKKCFIDRVQLGRSFKGRSIQLIIATKDKDSKGKNIKAEMQQIIGVKNQIINFPQKKGIFISARVHPGQVAASYMMNGFIKKLFDHSQQSNLLLQHFVFYIIPIINPDGVAQGNYRNDSQGQNLNRYYDNPTQQNQPQIYVIKKFLTHMIHKKRMDFCLDLHAHVNKQNCFIFGNSIPDLRKQLDVCLFAKMMSYNCEFFDFQSCNFSQKNMGSKDAGEQLTKQGASRVAIYKQTGLVNCWTLEVNYHSAKILNLISKPMCQDFSKSVTDTVIRDNHSPQFKNTQYFFQIKDFNKIGINIAETILDYYHLRKCSPIFNTRLKNYHNFRTSHAISVLRMIPFKFDTQARKLLNGLNSGVKNIQIMKKLEFMIGPGHQLVLHQKNKTNLTNFKPTKINSEQKIGALGKKQEQLSYQFQKRGKSTRGDSSKSMKSIQRKKQIKNIDLIQENKKAKKVSIKMNCPPLPLPKKQIGF